MKRVLLATLACTLFALAPAAFAPARAADIPPAPQVAPPVKAPAMVRAYNWTGFYVGVFGGYAFGRSNWTDTGDASTTGNFNASGALAGGTIGYNVQNQSFVLGLEADGAWSGIKGSTATACAPNCETKNNWLATGRVRVGYAFDRALPYLTGGVAAGNIRAGFAGSPTDNITKVGWTAGGGLEAAVAAPVSVKVEYLYVDLGKASCSIATCTGTGTTDVKFNAHVVKAGVNVKF